jgi:nitrite reductase/ring-hydroxylating ferredoxin subunit
MALIKIGKLEALPPGSAVHVDLDDDSLPVMALAVCNVGGTLHAMDGICPHSHGPLGHGALDGKIVICPYHAWGFDCVTGQSDVDDELKLATFPVTVENGEIFVEVK